MKYFFSTYFFTLAFTLANSYAQTLTQPLVNGLSQAEAIDFCNARGGRLPTIKELATYYAKILNATGVQEVPDNIKGVSIDNPIVKNHIRLQSPKLSFPVYKKMPNGVIAIDFYYSSVGARINNKSDLKFIWSSNIEPRYHDNGRLTNAYAFFFSVGQIVVTDLERNDDMFSVQCIE